MVTQYLLGIGNYRALIWTERRPVRGKLIHDNRTWKVLEKLQTISGIGAIGLESRAPKC